MTLKRTSIYGEQGLANSNRLYQTLHSEHYNFRDILEDSDADSPEEEDDISENEESLSSPLDKSPQTRE